MKVKTSLLVACGLLISQTAFSATLTMPGSACRAAQSVSVSNVENDGAIGVTNSSKDSTDIAWVSCPLEKVGAIKSVAVHVYHPDERTTTCVINGANAVTGVVEGEVIEVTGKGNLSKAFTSASAADSREVYGIMCLTDTGTVIRGYDWQN